MPVSPDNLYQERSPDRCHVNTRLTSEIPERRSVKTSTLLVAIALSLLFACAEQSTSFPSSEGKATPYVLKEGCTFSIVEERSKASIDSPTVSGMPGASASGSISLGEKSITVSDCKVIANSHALPIYED